MTMLAAIAPSAHAHAELLGTDPANETIVEEPPSVVTMSFTENVKVAFGGVKVYAPDGERAEGGEATVDGDTVSIPVDSDQTGTYAISWRAISADGHPIRGAFVYHVEEQSADDVSRQEALEASEENRAAAIAFGIARGGYLLGILAAVGTVVFAAFAAPRWTPRWLRASLLLAIVSMAAAYLLDASIATGLGLGDVVDTTVLREEAKTVYGRATLVRLVLALLCLALTWLVASARWHRSGIVRALVTLVFLALAAALSLSGHAVGEDVSALRLPLDMVHSMAAAVWIGGLLQLVPYARSGAVELAEVRRFSAFALASVIVLVLTGLYASWQEIGLEVDGVLETTYGRLVLAKVVLLAATMPIANANRTRTIRELAAAETAEEGRARLGRYVRIELVILTLVIAATAWLVQSVPAKVELRPAFVEQTLDLGSGGTVQLVIDPARSGSNEIHVYGFDEQRQPDGDITELLLTARLEERELGPLDIELEPVGPGHFTTGAATLPFAGDWDFDVNVKRGEFEEERASFSASISTSDEE